MRRLNAEPKSADPTLEESAETPGIARRGGGRRPYSPPRLEALGDLRSLTLGGSAGLGDSSDPFNTQPPQP